MGSGSQAFETEMITHTTPENIQTEYCVGYQSEQQLSINDGILWDDGLIYFGNERWGIEIVSENILAFYDILFRGSYTRFGLTPLYEYIPPIEIVDDGFGIHYDWNDFQHRLDEVSYHLTINESLESEVPTILRRILFIDGVAPGPNLPDGIPVARQYWTNAEVFERFQDENVNIVFVEDCADDFDILTSNLSWQVFSGGCIMNFDLLPLEHICYQHILYIWLVDFSNDEHRIIWDMKFIVEAGCGRPLLFN